LDFNAKNIYPKDTATVFYFYKTELQKPKAAFQAAGRGHEHKLRKGQSSALDENITLQLLQNNFKRLSIKPTSFKTQALSSNVLL